MRVRFRSEPRSPEELGGVRIPYPAATRGAHRLAWYLIVVAVLAPFLYLAARALLAGLSRNAAGSVRFEQQLLTAGAAGWVRQLTVAPGDRVSAGQSVVVIDSPALDAAIVDNRVDLQRLAQQGRSAAALRVLAGRQIAAQSAQVQYRRRRRDAVGYLFHQGAATAAELNAAQAALNAAELGLLQARRELLASAPPLGAALAERSLLVSQRAALTERARYAGRALEVLVKPGQYVSAGEPLVRIARLERARVVAYVPPRFATRLRVGDRATVYFPDGTRRAAAISATPALTASGPAGMADATPRTVTVVLELSLRAGWPARELVSGLPVRVQFERSRAGGPLGTLLDWLSG